MSLRVLPGRRCDGLHQAIEAKNGKIQPNFGDYYLSKPVLLYPKLAGMTGTAKTGRSGVREDL